MPKTCEVLFVEVIGTYVVKDENGNTINDAMTSPLKIYKGNPIEFSKIINDIEDTLNKKFVKESEDATKK